MPDILTPIRVSELPEASSVSDTDLLIIDNGEQTQKIPVGTFNEEATGSAKRYADEALLSAQNAETQAQAASGSATIAGNHAQDANKSAQDAEAWAVGKRNGADVPSTDEAYHNNAKYFSEQAHASATEAAGSADDAAQSAASISGLEDQIEQNTEDVTVLKSALVEIEPKILSEDAKQALLNCFKHVLWYGDWGETCREALEEALYPDTVLVRITAVFTQGSTEIYPSTPLNDLKAYLVVTGYYNDGTSRIITDYALSGTLEVGTSTITVLKEGKTDTFDVTVSEEREWDFEWDAASQELPTGMTADSYNFTSIPGYMLAHRPNMSFGEMGDMKLYFEGRGYIWGTNPQGEYYGSSPQFVISLGDGKGIKLVSEYGDSSSNPSHCYAIVTDGATKVLTGVRCNTNHTFEIEARNGVYSLKVDGTSVELTPSGSSQYFNTSGIVSSSFSTTDGKTARGIFKVIKYKKY